LVLVRIEFEVDVFDDEGPYVVAESVGVEVALFSRQCYSSSLSEHASRAYLEAQSRLDLVIQDFCDDSVKVLQHLDCNLWLDAAVGDKCVECFYQRGSDARIRSAHVVLCCRIGVLRASAVQLVESAIILCAAHGVVFLSEQEEFVVAVSVGGL
jgi:hypothetical protein